MRMSFLQFREVIRNHFNEMLQMSGISKLFVTDVNLDWLYEQYQDAFPAERNKIFRTRREHDCSACKHFFRGTANVIVIKPDYTIESLWDVKVEDPAFQQVADKLSKIVKAAAIKSEFIPCWYNVGHEHTNEINQQTGEVTKWEHFYVDIPNQMISQHQSRDIARSMGSAEVLQRSFEMISNDALDVVIDLINQNNLYRGAEKKRLVLQFQDLKQKYDALPDEKKPLFVWRESSVCSDSLSHFKNDVIGTLLTDITSGMDLDEAVRLYEAKTAPENYQRSKPVYSQKMLEDAQKKIEELGYMSALQRRFATIDDLTINEMKFVNRDVQSTPADAPSTPQDLFGEMKKTLANDPKKFRSAPSITVDQFMEKVLPDATSVDLLFEQQLTKNMVSLIAPVDPSAKSMFKWNNPFSWAYTGNMTDSSLKQNVKNAGGNVNGDLRFSIQWNDMPGQWDNNDLDAHCVFNNRMSHIFFNHKIDHPSGGNLDIDVIDPHQDTPAVENICFPDRHRMVPGEYYFVVHCYTNRGGRTGFRAEIEFDGQIYSFDYTNPVRQSEQILVATVTLDYKGNFTIKPELDSKVAGGREVWGIMTNQFVPVVAIMDSPNYWKPRETEIDPDKTIEVNYTGDPRGAHHLFFMLKDCKNPEEPNPFFNEYLNSDFKDFRRVMEALGSKAHVQTVDDQLSGVGFAYTQHANIVVRVDGDCVYNVKM